MKKQISPFKINISDERLAIIMAKVIAYDWNQLLPTPRSFAEKTYHVIHWTEMPAGGHFAALEQPELMLADFRKFILTASGGQG